MVERFVQVRTLRDRAALDAHLTTLGIALPFADDPAMVLGAPLRPQRAPALANRFAVLPMEGWDGTPDGRPTDLVRRRWSRFGASGAGMIWGGEAVAVLSDGRANPRQLTIGPESIGDLAALRKVLVDAHPGPEPPVIGLQLTHSGRWSRPEGEPAPRVAYRHPVLDARVGVTDAEVVSDAWLDDLVGHYVHGARVAAEAGFDFVDVKSCHGYLLHELLSAHERPGPYGGDLDGRARFLTRTVAAIRRDVPEVAIGVRLSVFDVVPHERAANGEAVPSWEGPYPCAFGGDGTGYGVDLTEVHALCDRLAALGVTMLCVTAASPYYAPHVQRPAYFPPSDGYRPPRDPLHEVARLVQVTGELTRAHRDLLVVASGLSYLQEWLPAVAAGVVAEGIAPVVGYGRGVLSYPELPRDVCSGAPVVREQLCRTFSDCTTAPRNGLVSGCYPLDPAYKEREDRVELTKAKKAARV